MLTPLSEYTLDRNNNFNLIRFVAALLVLFSHSYPLALGRGAAEPLGGLIGLSFGELAVDVFFITSGFLVTQSLVNQPSLTRFFWARILRIFPALIIAILFCVFVVGVFFTTIPTSDFLIHNQVLTYIQKNMTLLFGIRYELPGVFEDNIYPGAVNGSIWTLPWELKMYILLGLCAVLARQKKGLLIIAIAILGTAGYIVDHLNLFGGLETDPNKPRFLAFFFLGSLYYLFKEHVMLSKYAFWFLFAILVVLTVTQQQTAFFVIYTLSLAYLVFYIAYIPKGSVLLFNRTGDYSYGIYIYAFPIQQSIMALHKGIGPIELFVYALPLTLLAAILSWHLIEKPCLRMKGSHSISRHKTTQSL